MRAQKEKGLVGYMDHCKSQGKPQKLFPSLGNIMTGIKSKGRR